MDLTDLPSNAAGSVRDVAAALGLDDGGGKAAGVVDLEVEDVPVGEPDGEASADLDSARRAVTVGTRGVVEGCAFELEGERSQYQSRAWGLTGPTPMFRVWPCT